MSDKRRKIIIILAIAIITEVFCGNFAFWNNIGNKEEIVDVFLDDGTPIGYGISYTIDEDFSLNIHNINKDIGNIYIEINEMSLDRIITNVEITDEGHNSLYQAAQKAITPKAKTSEYISLEPFGKVSDVRVTFDVEEEVAASLNDVTVSFNKVSVDKKVPFNFSIVRLVLIAGFLWIINLFLFEKYISGEETKKQKIKTIIVLIITILVSLCILRIVRGDVPNTDGNYQDLARAFTKGNLYISETTDEVLLNMDNPYDYKLRIENCTEPLWDTAYFEGKYYIYFGVTPVLLMFLPYYLLTGSDMSYFMAMCILAVLVSIAAFYLVSILKKKYFKKMPWKLEMLFSVVMAFVPANVLCFKRIQIYYIVILTAVMLTMFGLCLWFKASENLNKREGYIQLAAGAFLMALAVGARPQFAMASLLAIPIFWEQIKKISKNIKWLLAFIIPYIPVAAFLMWYNYARFGSPFDFGANYNLTCYDMVHMGFHPSRLIVGIWYYLFHLPQLRFEFPYLIFQNISTEYPGFVFLDRYVGGAMTLMPITFILFLLLWKQNRKNIKTNATMMGVFCAVIPVIVIFADTIMCGVCMRYQMDFRIYLLLGSFIIAMIGLNNACAENCFLNIKIHKIESAYKAIAVLLIATIVFGVLTLFAQYEASDYSVTAIYSVIREYLGLFVF